MHVIRRTRGRLALGALALLALAAGAAYASIPDAAGVIHGCYRTSTDDQKGQLRVVEDAASCRSNETPIQWNQQGEPGPAGPAGPQGTPGEDGDPFSGTFTSPNGLFSLSVTDAGIELRGVGSRIALDAGGIVVDSASRVDVRGATVVNVRAGASVTVESSGVASVRAGGPLQLDGAFVSVKPGAGCRPTARVGDLVAGGAIVTGSPTVCVG